MYLDTSLHAVPTPVCISRHVPTDVSRYARRLFAIFAIIAIKEAAPGGASAGEDAALAPLGRGLVHLCLPHCLIAENEFWSVPVIHACAPMSVSISNSASRRDGSR